MLKGNKNAYVLQEINTIVPLHWINNHQKPQSLSRESRAILLGLFYFTSPIVTNEHLKTNL